MAKAVYTLLHGDDDLRIEEEVAKLLADVADQPNADLNTARFDASVSVPELLGAAMAYPFLADVRLVIVKDLLAWLARKGAGETGKKALDQLAEALPTIPDWTRLIFVERGTLPDSHKIVKTASGDERGSVRKFTVPDDSTEWIIQRARGHYNAQIEPNAAAALASVTPGDLRRADNELYKLIAYVGLQRAITEADVALLTPYVAEANMFAMVDALAEGRAQTALALLYRLLDQGEDVFSLFGMITRQFRLLLLAKEHLTNGGGRGDLLAVLSTKSKFVADKVATQSRGFDLPTLERIYRTLHDYDVKMKTGGIEPRLALDLLVAGLSR